MLKPRNHLFIYFCVEPQQCYLADMSVWQHKPSLLLQLCCAVCEWLKKKKSFFYSITSFVFIQCLCWGCLIFWTILHIGAHSMAVWISFLQTPLELPQPCNPADSSTAAAALHEIVGYGFLRVTYFSWQAPWQSCMAAGQPSCGAYGESGVNFSQRVVINPSTLVMSCVPDTRADRCCSAHSSGGDSFQWFESFECIHKRIQLSTKGYFFFKV